MSHSNYSSRIREAQAQMRHQFDFKQKKVARRFNRALRDLINEHFRETLGLRDRTLFRVRKQNLFTHTNAYLYFFDLVAVFVEFDCRAELNHRGNLMALANMARYYENFRIRDLSEFQRKEKNARMIMRELADHLYERYEVPNFLRKMLFRTESKKVRTWYLFIAQGGSMRELPEPP
ncbi:MAG: hypothetical protein AAF570_03620, partial [Bacteroidota bacterium]